MPAPFYNAIKGTTAGTPGTGAFTPNAAATGFRAWSTAAPAGWIGLVRYEDGSAWELAYSYWNGTTLSRSAAQVYDSSTGSQLTLTSSATAAMVDDAADVMSHLGGTTWRGWFASTGSTTAQAISCSAPTALGTVAQPVVGTGSALAAQQRLQYTSLTTANAQAGWASSESMALASSVAGRGGFEYTARFGASQLPTGPRLMAGLATNGFNASTAEPSAFAQAVAAFAKDSTDTNIQLLTRPFGGPATKTDTGIPLAVNAWYEATVWSEPGSLTVYGLLIRMDTGDIWLGKNTTNVPATGSGLDPNLVGGLNGTNTGTAIILHCGGMMIRNGF